MKHGADESSFGICARTILSSDATHRGGNREPTTPGDASALFATLDQTVSALKGDVPGGSLERLGEPSRYLTVVLECVDALARASRAFDAEHMQLISDVAEGEEGSGMV